MKIRYQPRLGFQTIELSSIKGGHPLAKWNAGDEREIPPDLKVSFAERGKTPTSTDAATAIFRHGPDFVDAATGKNPLYACADCGVEALDECWWELYTLKEMPFETDDGKRQCIPCWLSHHPERFVEFRSRSKGMMKHYVDQAQAIIAKRDAATSAPSPTKPVVASGSAAQQEA